MICKFFEKCAFCSFCSFFYMLICKMDVVPKALIPPLKEHRQYAGAFFIPQKEKTDGIQEYTEL